MVMEGWLKETYGSVGRKEGAVESTVPTGKFCEVKCLPGSKTLCG
jgi:hypothetical protein